MSILTPVDGEPVDLGTFDCSSSPQPLIIGTFIIGPPHVIGGVSFNNPLMPDTVEQIDLIPVECEAA